MDINVLLIGNGAREHILAQRMLESTHSVSLYAFMSRKNPAIAKLSTNFIVGNLLNNNLICEFAKRNAITFAVIGPEEPLANGVADALRAIGIPSVGPKKLAAQLESSKSFTRQLFEKYEIMGNPEFKVFSSMSGMREYMEAFSSGFVIKADGLCQGKGVKVSGSDFEHIEDGLAYAQDCIERDGCVVVEERLVGQEFSLIGFTDGLTVKDTIPVQDHKRAFNGDNGPHTGGMGSYSCANHLLPFLSPDDVAQASEINRRVIAAIKQEVGVAYEGILYGSFMVTKSGVKLIEYNVRFGDPEVHNILSLLEGDLIEIFLGIVHTNLAEVSVSFARKASVCKCVAPQGYPDHPIRGQIKIGSIANTVEVYYGGVVEENGSLVMIGPRALGVVSVDDSLATAEQEVERAIRQISGEVFHRSDIATKGLLDSRVAMMNHIRGHVKNDLGERTLTSSKLLDGTVSAQKIKDAVKREIEEKDLAVGLAVVLVGDDPASEMYVSAKQKACAEVGIVSKKIVLPKDTPEEEVLRVISELNAASDVNGILVQMPLPKHISQREVIEHIDFRKDVDGFHPVNSGLLANGDPLFIPCTPKGIIRLLDDNAISIEAKHVVILGRSVLVGKPLAQLFLARNATVTLCHSKTKNLADFTKQADILVVACGRQNLVTKEMVTQDCVLVDVGINRVDADTQKGYKIVGDVDFAGLNGYVKALSPVPGGVGPMTIACLLENTLFAARQFGSEKNR